MALVNVAMMQSLSPPTVGGGRLQARPTTRTGAEPPDPKGGYCYGRFPMVVGTSHWRCRPATSSG